jgi:hypothetical protein
MNALPDIRADPRALRVRKRPDSLRVVFAAADGVCETLEGPVQYRAGDAVLTGIQGERWPVKRDLFLASYEPVPPTVAEDDGIYCKLPSEALALRLDRPVRVPVGWRDDPLRGRPGDWLLRYADGSHGVMRDEIFRTS